MKVHQYKSLDHFVTKQKELLKLEQNEEVSERQQMYENKSIKDLIKKGVCVNRLQVDHQTTGLYGKHVIVFVLNQRSNTSAAGGQDHIASHRLTSGDIVGLYPNKGDNSDIITSGLVARSRSNTISVAFNEVLELSTSSLYRLMKLTNDVTYRRLNRAIDELSKRKSEQSPFLDLLFPCQTIQEPSTVRSTGAIDHFFNQGLDSSQREAVRFVVDSGLPLTVIHGPPGTGKTTTVVEVARQECKKFFRKILVCAPSNIAVDNLVERLAKADLKVVRLGHPARVIEEVQKYSLDAILDSRDSSSIIKDVKAEISALCSSKSKERGRQRWDEVKKLKKELVSRQEKAITSVLTSADVVLATTTSASLEGPLKHLPAEHFDVLIVDEAAQAMEMSCWIPLLQVKRCILAGDHFQLPPTIISEKAASAGLATTLLERVVHGLGENAVKMLTVQYRMNKLIMQWPSQQLYQNKLLAADVVADHTLCDLDGVVKSEDTENPFVFVDTAGCNMHELEESDEDSKGNTWEVQIVHKHIEQLVGDGLQTRHIGVITPYNLQVEMLRQSIHPQFPQVEINSVDGFQGREKEAILISLVRSNEEGEIGFLKEDRRINVALTRARRHLFVVCDSVTVSNHPFLESLCSFMFEQAIVRSPLYEDEMCSGATHAASTAGIAELELTHESQVDKPQIRKIATKEERVEPKKQSVSDVPFKQSALKSHTTGQGKTDKPTDSITASESGIDKSQAILEEKLLVFSKSSERTFEFSKRLSSRQRLFVHEKAEELGLNHTSGGEGWQRRIVVTKKGVEPHIENDFIIEDDTMNAEEDVAESQPTTVTCPKCKVLLPKGNFQLHQLRCNAPPQEHQRNQASSNSSVKPSDDSGHSGAARKKTKKPKKKTSTKETKNESEENVDDLLEEFAKMNSKCTFAHCKTSIKLLGQKCHFCSQMFCLSHHMAEVHGCGAAAKVSARRDISKYADNKPRAMNTIKKAQVHRKLDKKLGELEEERKRKAKKK